MIRKSTKADASRIAEILIFAKRTAYRDIFKNDKVSFGEMQVLPLALAYIDSPDLLADLFVYDDGFVKGILNISIDENTANIHELYIDPFFQKQRIGAELIKFAEEYLYSLNISTVSLWVLEKNVTARKFYENHGFIPTSERKPEAGTEEYILKYKKAL